MTAAIYLIFLLILIAILATILIVLKKTRPVQKPYTLTSKFFTRSEREFYYLLKMALKDTDVLLFAKVRLADITNVTVMNRNYTHWNKISAKHVDFLICARDSTPLLCIELDGDSHKLYKMKQNDAFKDALFNDIGLPLIRFEVAQQYDFSKVLTLVTQAQTNKPAP